MALGDVSQESSEAYAVGLISYQDTTAGELVDQGTKINVTISTGPSSTETRKYYDPDNPSNVRYVGTLLINDINPFDFTGDGKLKSY